MVELYLDFDAHKVFLQVLQAAQRHALELYVVTRDYLDVEPHVHLIFAEDQQPNRGAWIAANIRRGDICITGDAGLALGCILKGASALTPAGRQWPDGIANDDARGPAASPGERWAFDARLLTQGLERAIATQGIELRSFSSPRSFLRAAAANGVARPAVPSALHG